MIGVGRRGCPCLNLALKHVAPGARSPEPGRFVLTRSILPRISLSLLLNRRSGKLAGGKVARQEPMCNWSLSFVSGLDVGIGPRVQALADANRLDPVLADGLHADRVAVVHDGVAALGQAPQLAEDEAADRVVRVTVHGQLEAVVDEV